MRMRDSARPRPASALAALAAFAALSGAAHAQTPVPFETVAQGSHGGADRPAQHVIRSEAELTSSGVRPLLPAGTRVDFAREMLVAVFSGTKPSGGHAVTVTSIVREQLMTIQPVPTPPPSFVHEVRYFERSPAPGEIVTMALTSPFHVVKLARTADRVTFAAQAAPGAPAGPGPVPFETVAQGTYGGPGQAGRVVVRTDAELTSSGVNRLLPAGTRIDFSREMLVAVFQGSRPTGGHAITITGIEREQLMTIQPVPTPPPSFQHVVRYVERSPGPGEIVTMAFTAPFHVVKLPLTRDAFRFEATAPAAAAPFDTLSYSHLRNPGELTTTLELDGRGAAGVFRSSPTARYLPVHGQATQRELEAVRDGLARARLSTLPAQLPTPTYVMPGDSFQLDVRSQVPGNQGTTGGDPGVLMTYEARVKPLLDALEAIVARLVAPPIADVTGRVRLAGQQVSLVAADGAVWQVSGHGADAVRRFPGRTVTLRGATSPGAIDATDVLDPQKQGELAVTPRRVGNRLALEVGGEALEAFGPAAPALRGALGLTASVDGHRFTADRAFYVEAVWARTAWFTPLHAPDGRFLGYVLPGRRVRVEGVSTSGQYARVAVGSYTGIMPITRLRLGQPAPGPTPGISGSVPR